MVDIYRLSAPSDIEVVKLFLQKKLLSLENGKG